MHPAVQGAGPAASAGAVIDEGAENKRLRRQNGEPQGLARDRTRSPGKTIGEPKPIEPGMDLNQSRPANRQRDIDEVNPYAK